MPEPSLEAQDEDSSARQDEERANPCAHEPRGNAYGRDRLCPPQGGGSGVARGDFNGDGSSDLAIGVPGEDFEIFNADDAGAVNIIYSSPFGLRFAKRV